MRQIALLVAMVVWLLPQLSYAQQRTVSGTVTDANGAPLPLVSVVERGGRTGTTTNEQGQFTLTLTSARPVLVFTYTGLQQQEVVVGNSNTYNVTMRPGGGTMSEVVVTALGIRREKKALGYSSQEVKVEEVTQTRQPNIVNALQGRATGVQINSTGGAPGQGARIVMRGINSLDPNRPFQPLFIVDGIPIDNSTDLPAGSSHVLRGMTNRAADINPDDIESINILKGGAATALYGLRAANGAVVITTRSGKAGRVRASVTSTYGIENVNKFPEVQKTFTQGYYDPATGKPKYDAASFWPSWGPSVAEAKAIDPSHPDELFNNYERGYQQGNFFRNTVNLSGGSEVATFAASLSQYNHEGVLPFSDYQNYSGKINGEIKASSKFRIGASANFINSGGYRVNADRYNEQLSYWPLPFGVKVISPISRTLLAGRRGAIARMKALWPVASNDSTLSSSVTSDLMIFRATSPAMMSSRDPV